MKRITGRESSGACSIPNSSLHLIKKFFCFIILASIVFLGFALFSPDALQAADTGLRSPTSNLADTGGDGNGYQGSPSNAHADDTLNAVDTDSGSNTGTSCTGTDKDKHRFYDYGFSIPGGSTVNGIEVRLDARADSTTGTPRICVQLSWDGGTTWTAAKTSANLTTTLATYTLGNATDNWGRTWGVNDFNNANFRVRLINIASNISRDFTLDWVAVRVHFTTPTPPTITSTPVTTGNVGQAYSYQATATGTTPITWSLVSPPSGMTIGATTGLVTWTPGAAGGFPVTVRATNSVGSVDQSYTIVVSTPANTGLRSPTANAAETSSAGDNNGYQTSPGNAHGDDTLNAVDTDSGSNTGTSCTGTDKDKHRFYDYGFSIPGGSTVNGIEVRLDARADSTTGTPRICVQLSWDGGTTWTAAKTSANLTTTLATYTLGNATDNWGRTWGVNDFNNANFRVRLINIASNISRDFTLDWVAVRVNYSIPPSPQISSLTPNTGPVGTSVTIAGSNFGASAGAVTFNGTAAAVSSWNSSSITVQVPANATSGPVVVTTSGGIASSGVTFTVVIPSISGAITRSSDGAAISGALVEALQLGLVKGFATTASNGSYSLLSLSAGTYDIRVSANGYVTKLQTGVPVVAGSTTTVNMALATAGAISGRVTRADGTTPIVGAAVEFYQGPTSVGVAATNSSGDYSFTKLSPGTYTVQASSVGYVMQNRTGVTVTAGGNTAANFSLDAAPSNNTISYMYDELGRLVGVVDPAGESAIYTYDAVGNLLSISRQSSTVVSIVEFTPSSGPVGTSVTISGTGFSTVASENTVTFNGVSATVASATATQIVATVPTGATSGLIAVSNTNGSSTSGDSFTVTSAVSITLTPATATVVAGTSKQFTANVIGTADQRVIWRLEGVGSFVAGGVSSTGLFSVPSTFTETAMVIVRVISLADPSKYATATVLAAPSTPLGPYISPQVSVAIGQSATSSLSGPFVAPQVSVAIGQSATSSLSGPFVAPQVSVGMNQSSNSSGLFDAPQVSVSLVPIISAITPNNGVQGTTDLLITITGTGLSSAMSLGFLLDGAPDTSMTFSNLTSNVEGTQATGNITISSTAPIGLRVVQITTSNGISPAAMTEGNVFNVTVP